MSGPVVISPGGGEVIADSPGRRVEILSDRDELHATCARLGPGQPGADLHVHRRHADLFHVLAGELTVRLGPAGEPVAVPAGTLVCVPPLVVHGFANDGGEELRYLNLHAPGVGFADYMRALRDGRTLAYDQEPPPANGGRAPSEVVIGGPVETAAITVAERRGEPSPVGAGRVASYFVLDGELAVDGRRAPAGSWIQLPPGAAATVSASESARYLEIRS